MITAPLLRTHLKFLLFIPHAICICILGILVESLIKLLLNKEAGIPHAAPQEISF